MVSKARDDLPEPLRPVMTTSLSRGIFSVRFLRLCSRAPPILINSLLTDREFSKQTIREFTPSVRRLKGERSSRSNAGRIFQVTLLERAERQGLVKMRT